MNNVKRIVAFGDSNTFGHGLEDNILDENQQLESKSKTDG